MTLFVYISPLNFPDNTHCPNIPMSENNLSGLCPKNPFDFRFLGGYFIPGRYYKEKRDDLDGSLFSPCVRGDGNPNNAYQFEFFVELTF